MDLPRSIILISEKNMKYLRYVKEGGEIDGLIQASSDAVLTPYTKFEVERSKTPAGRFVHLRCCYNNKYLVRQNADSNFIVAASNEPEEDQTKWSCTLFDPIPGNLFRFIHVQLVFYVSLSSTSNQFINCLYAKSSTPETDNSDVFNVMNWESFCQLPKFVAFKQGSFLKCYDYDGNKYLQFGASDVNDELAGHQVFTLNDGRIQIKSTHWNFWRLDPDWIKADLKDPESGGANSIFWPFKVADSSDKLVVALMNYGNGFYCKRLTLDDKENCLNASADTITDEAKMEVYDYVISREIYNVQFQTKDARMHGTKPRTMASKNSVNRTDEPLTTKLGLQYENSKSSTWAATMGMKVGVKTTLATGVPFIAEGKIEIAVELTTEYSWGETIVKTEVVSTDVEVTVPPKSERRVSMVAIEGQCDIPFTYTQKDYLANGEVDITEKYDGIYSGLNYYSFQEVVDDPLSLL